MREMIMLYLCYNKNHMMKRWLEGCIRRDGSYHKLVVSMMNEDNHVVHTEKNNVTLRNHAIHC